MTLVTPSLVFSKVSIVYTSILILQTSPQVMLLTATSTMLSVIRVLHLMTQVSSTAHMYLCRWYVQSVRTPSNQKSDSRPATAWLRTHLQKEPPLAQVVFVSTATVTTDVLQSRTSCDPYSQSSEETFGSPFFMSTHK